MAWAKAKPGFNGRMKEQALTSKWRIKEEKTWNIGMEIRPVFRLKYLATKFHSPSGLAGDLPENFYQ
jgi:hypothetical protein